MFLCEKCHDNPCFHMFRSYGRCELCGMAKSCVECFAHKTRDRVTAKDDAVLAAILNAPIGEPMPESHRAAVDASMAELEAGAPTFTMGEVLLSLRQMREKEAPGEEPSGVWIEFERAIAEECERSGLTEAQLAERAGRKRAACAEARARLDAMAKGEEASVPMAQVYAEVKAKYST